MEITKELREVLDAYGFADRVLMAEHYGNGHINDTVLLTLNGKTEDKVILQRINTAVFNKPQELMNNITRVTSWIASKVEAEGGDKMREVLHIIPSKTGLGYYQSQNGSFYRAYTFIKNGICLEQPQSRSDFYESGVAFGRFQGYLADFPAEELYETIPDFHNTGKRFEAFENVLRSDNGQPRFKEAQNEITYALLKKSMIDECEEKRKMFEIPLRVTHNDTKLNNAMLDASTKKALCVLDLDTVMPGYAMDDFGDSIRFGANTACEDEKDLSKVSLNLELFRAYAEGFLTGTGGRLTEKEIRLFPLGAKMMTYECGIRFLTDFLQGDIYFKTAYQEHNLVRAKNQFALLQDMDGKTEQMEQIIGECL